MLLSDLAIATTALVFGTDRARIARLLDTTIMKYAAVATPLTG